MTPSPVLPLPQLELTLTRFETPIEVDMERFFEFSFDLAEDILDMEARFKAQRNQRRDRCSGRIS
ncbi:hypothetical protein OAG71_04600 [bacterium]|nr:hypothetical protein [bacterium]